MTALIERRRYKRVLCLAISILAMGFFADRPAFADGGGGDDGIDIVLDQARLIKLPERASTLVIGNPLIADVSMQSSGLMVVTGKGYGVTNLIALDRNGATLMEKQVSVKGPYANTVVVYRGMARETYSCAPFCEPRVTLGDASAFFTRNLTETTTWINQVQGASQLGVK
jgi:Flp pilus assembly secretin CpaC